MASTKVVTQCPVCGDEVEWGMYREKFGADADGNRGVMQTNGEVNEPCGKDCEWTDEEYEVQFAEAEEKFEKLYWEDFPDEADRNDFEIPLPEGSEQGPPSEVV